MMNRFRLIAGAYAFVLLAASPSFAADMPRGYREPDVAPVYA